MASDAGRGEGEALALKKYTAIARGVYVTFCRALMVPREAKQNIFQRERWSGGVI